MEDECWRMFLHAACAEWLEGDHRRGKDGYRYGHSVMILLYEKTGLEKDVG